MNFSRRFCCVLLCVCMLFALCSASSFALEVDGYSINTYWHYTEVSEQIPFTGTIETEDSPNILYVTVDILTSYSKGTVFDLSLGYNSGGYDSIDIVKVETIDTNNEVTDTFQGEIDTDSIYCGGIKAPKNMKSVRVTLVVILPQYYTPLTFTVTYSAGAEFNQTYQYIDGMTFSEWIESDYNVDGFVLVQNPTNSTQAIVAFPDGDKYRLLLVRYNGEGYNYNTPSDHVISQNDIYRLAASTTQTPFSGVPGDFDFNVTSCSITVVDSGGLLSGIIDWVKQIWNALLDIPSKIGNAINDVIISLFVPSEESMTEIKDKFESLLADRFGAAYEASDIVDDFSSAFTYNGSKSTITFPQVSVNLAGSQFIFGGWEVDLIPKGMEMLFSALKVISNVVCTFMFVNALKKRFEGVVGS